MLRYKVGKYTIITGVIYKCIFSSECLPDCRMGLSTRSDGALEAGFMTARKLVVAGAVLTAGRLVWNLESVFGFKYVSHDRPPRSTSRSSEWIRS